MLKDILSIGDDAVVEAADGADAVNFYQKHMPDVLLLDLAMPKNRLTVIRVLQIDPNTKVILIIANDDQKVVT